MTIAIIDDHQLVRLGLRMQLQPHYDILLDTDSAETLYAAAEETPVDILISDVMMPVSGMDVARYFREHHPDTKILMLSQDTTEYTLRQLLEIGVNGFVSKSVDTEELLEALSRIAQGESYFGRDIQSLVDDIIVMQASGKEPLTERELQILVACCSGKPSKDLADQLFLSARTIDNYKAHIFQKLGVNSTVELLLLAQQKGIIHI